MQVDYVFVDLPFIQVVDGPLDCGISGTSLYKDVYILRFIIHGSITRLQVKHARDLKVSPSSQT